MVCAVDFTMKASPLTPPSPVSDIEMNIAQLTRGGGGGLHQKLLSHHLLCKLVFRFVLI